jgi:hypothetical protein
MTFSEIQGLVRNVYALYREATQWWFHLVVDLEQMDILQTYPCNSHGWKIWKLTQAFKYSNVRKWFYFIVLVLLYWNKHNRATFFGKYKI